MCNEVHVIDREVIMLNYVLLLLLLLLLLFLYAFLLFVVGFFWRGRVGGGVYIDSLVLFLTIWILSFKT